MSHAFYTTSPIVWGGIFNLGTSLFARKHAEPSTWPYVVGGLGVFFVGFGMFGTWNFCRMDRSAGPAWMNLIAMALFMLPAALLYRISPYTFFWNMSVILLVAAFLGTLLLQALSGGKVK
jgi:uncharacterized membrane protein